MPETRTLIRFTPLAAATALCAAVALWPQEARAQRICEPDDVTGQRCTPAPTETPTPPACDWECKEYNRQQARERRAWKANNNAAKANNKGSAAFNLGRFDEARKQYHKALQAVPNHRDALYNLSLLDDHERYFNYAMGREALDRGEFPKAREHFSRVLAMQIDPVFRAQIQRLLAEIDYLSKFKPAGSMIMLGTGVKTGWNVRSGEGGGPARPDQVKMIEDQLALAGRSFPEGVNVELYNIGLGIAVSESVGEDLYSRVLDDQWVQVPVPRSGTSAYNSIKGKRFDLLGCHSNGAMTCLHAIYNGDAAARDVVLYGPQITPYAAAAWQRILAKGRIRSLRIIINDGDVVPPLAMVVNSFTLMDQSSTPLMFNSSELKFQISRFVPDAQVEVRSCAFKPLDPLACHFMTAYPQCRPGRSQRIVPGTKGLLDKSYTEPPPPNC